MALVTGIFRRIYPEIAQPFDKISIIRVESIYCTSWYLSESIYCASWYLSLIWCQVFHKSFIASTAELGMHGSTIHGLLFAPNMEGVRCPGLRRPGPGEPTNESDRLCARDFFASIIFESE